MVLPVKQDDVYMGFAEINGLLRHEKDTIILEYQLKDDVFGMFDSEMKVCKIPLNIIDIVEVEKKWFSGRFNIYLNRLVPVGNKIRISENCLSFKIRKKALEKAKSLKTQIMIELSEQKLRDLESDTEEIDQDHYQTRKKEQIDFSDTESQYTSSSVRGRLKNMLRNEDSD